MICRAFQFLPCCLLYFDTPLYFRTLLRTDDFVNDYFFRLKEPESCTNVWDVRNVGYVFKLPIIGENNRWSKTFFAEYRCP